jgi:RHS repeat-associated protein
MLNLPLGATQWTYQWDGENRLVRAEKDDTVIENVYDYMSRRVEKTVTVDDEVTRQIRFVYDGYQLIQELDALNDNALIRSYVWNSEKLASVTDHTGEALVTYYYLHDTNKNVSELVSSTGAVVAHYEYDPFGALSTSTGAYAQANPFRFSNEYSDDDLCLVYYNYRYYSPKLGRWLSRDPIEEQGGLNLYGFVGNQAINNSDVMGLMGEDMIFIPPNSTQYDPKTNTYNPTAEIDYVLPVNKGFYINGPKNLVKSSAYSAYKAHPCAVVKDIYTGEKWQEMEQKWWMVTHPSDVYNNAIDGFKKKMETGEGVGELGFDCCFILCLPVAIEAAPARFSSLAGRLSRLKPKPGMMPKGAILENATALEPKPIAAPNNLPVKWDGEFAAKQVLGHDPVTPSGRQINFHAADRMVNPPAGRVPMNAAQVDDFIDTATAIKKIKITDEGTSVTLLNPKYPKAQVAVDGNRVITVINPKMKIKK